MDPRKNTLERAFDLARAGRHTRLSDLIDCLNREGYDGWRVDGPILKKQLSNLIKEAKTTHSPPATEGENQPHAIAICDVRR